MAGRITAPQSAAVLVEVDPLDERPSAPVTTRFERAEAPVQSGPTDYVDFSAYDARLRDISRRIDERNVGFVCDRFAGDLEPLSDLGTLHDAIDEALDREEQSVVNVMRRLCDTIVTKGAGANGLSDEVREAAARIVVADPEHGLSPATLATVSTVRTAMGWRIFASIEAGMPSRDAIRAVLFGRDGYEVAVPIISAQIAALLTGSAS